MQRDRVSVEKAGPARLAVSSNECCDGPELTRATSDACLPGHFGRDCAKCVDGCSKCDEGVTGTGVCLDVSTTANVTLPSCEYPCAYCERTAYIDGLVNSLQLYQRRLCHWRVEVRVQYWLDYGGERDTMRCM